MHAELVAQHAFHLDAGHAADRYKVDDSGTEIKTHPALPMRPVANRHDGFANHDQNKNQPAHGHSHLARFSWVVQSWKQPAIARGFEDGEIIGRNAPASCLSKHVHVPMAPPKLAK